MSLATFFVTLWGPRAKRSRLRVRGVVVQTMIHRHYDCDKSANSCSAPCGASWWRFGRVTPKAMARWHCERGSFVCLSVALYKASRRVFSWRSCLPLRTTNCSPGV